MFSLIENFNPERIHANMTDDGLVYHLIFKWGVVMIVIVK